MPNTMTLRDVAVLCSVERPLVTMWRKRTSVHGRLIPFPAPVSVDRGVEHFDVDEIRDYLAETGRGKNPEAGLEANTLAVPDGVTLDELITLLCLRHLVEDDLTDQDLLALAAAVDPADRYIAAEIAEVLPDARGYVDKLMAASFGPEDAVARLLATRLGRTEESAELTADGIQLIAPLLQGLLVHLGVDTTDLVDGSNGRSSAVLQLAAALGRPVLIEGAEPTARAARRRAVLAGVDLPERARAQALVIDCVVSLPDTDALDRADLLATELGAGDLGLVIGPARLLTDRLRGAAARVDRDKQATLGGLRAAVRLPRRLFPGASRQSLAIWVLSGALAPDRPPRVADLGDLPAATVFSSELATDLVAAVSNPRDHHFGYLVPRRTTDLGGGRAVVPRGLRAGARPGASGAPGRFQDLVRAVAAPLPSLTVEAVAADNAGREVTVAQLRTQGDLVVRSGSRLDIAWSSETGTVTTVGVESWRAARFDPLDLELHAPQARRTEPGDVVFTNSPPAAEVDPEGGHLVPHPARILRLGRAAPLGPHALAAQINQQNPSTRDLDAWTLRISGDPDLERRLADLAALRADLASRIESLDELAHHLVDGVAGLALDITPAN